MNLLVIIIAPLAEITITFLELVTLLVFLGGIVGVWIAVKVKIAKLETTLSISLKALQAEFDLKIKTIDSKTMGLSDFMAVRLTEFVTGNKDDHNEIKLSVNELFKLIREQGKEIAKITPYQHST